MLSLKTSKCTNIFSDAVKKLHFFMFLIILSWVPILYILQAMQHSSERAKNQKTESKREIFAYRIDKNWKKTSWTLLKVLAETPIGEWFYATVSKVDLDFKGKKLAFAKKTFKNPDKSVQISEFQHSLDMRRRLKSAGLPTWQTYRPIKGENQILMTLGNKDQDMLISPHNLWEKEKVFLQGCRVNLLEDQEVFFQDIFSLIQKSSDNKLSLAWDACFLKVHDQKVSLLVGDFDQIGVWKRNVDEHIIFSSNIEQLWLFLLEIEKNLNIQLYSDFFTFLIKEQNSGLINQKIDLEYLKAKVLYTMNGALD